MVFDAGAPQPEAPPKFKEAKASKPPPVLLLLFCNGGDDTVDGLPKSDMISFAFLRGAEALFVLAAAGALKSKSKSPLPLP